MTVCAIMAGLLPIMWSHGTGAEVMQRIAVSMIGGMLSSTLLTLIVIPAIYAVIKGAAVHGETGAVLVHRTPHLVTIRNAAARTPQLFPSRFVAIGCEVVKLEDIWGSADKANSNKPATRPATRPAPPTKLLTPINPCHTSE